MNNDTYIGRQLGNYRITTELASGSFGRIYLAQHLLLKKRTVAIKLLHTAHLGSQEERESFLQEAEFLELLKHPHILPILDVGIDDGFPYIVAEYAAAGSLRDRIKHSAPYHIPLQEALTILIQVGDGLEYAHQLHIIHRDLKPENILFDAKGEALLADFGLATTLDEVSIKYVNSAGTPRYMAPEQFKGTVGKESDQYSLACIAYELVAGGPPFTTSDFFTMGLLHMSETPTPPRQINPDIPPHIDQAIMKALAKQRSDRYQDVAAFIAALTTTPVSQELATPTDQSVVPTIIPTIGPISAPTSPTSTAPANGDEQTKGHREEGIPALEEPQSVQPGSTQKLSPVQPFHQHRPDAPHLPSGRPSAARLPRWIFVVLPLVILIFFGGILFSAFYPFKFSNPAQDQNIGNTPATARAMIIITPLQKDLMKDYTISAVTGMPDATQNQVSARQVSYTTNSQSQTEVATGSGTNPATYATGTITFTNGANYSQTFPAGIVFTDNNNIQFTNDEAANLAPLGSATVSAHALVAGPSGNVPIGDINTGSADSHVGMYNNVPFTGGQNAQPYTFVQQSDIDGAATPLKQSLTQSAQASFQQAIHPNEQLLTSPQCTTSVASNHTAGDKASSVTVTVSATCSGEVYDRVAALAMTKTLFASDTTLVPYTITGAISTTILKAILADAKQGTLSLLTQARGTGTYQFNEAQKSNLAQLVAGKSFQDAKNLLLTEEGVSNVTISGANGKILPQDTRLITIIITEQATK